MQEKRKSHQDLEERPTKKIKLSFPNFEKPLTNALMQRCKDLIEIANLFRPIEAIFLTASEQGLKFPYSYLTYIHHYFLHDDIRINHYQSYLNQFEEVIWRRITLNDNGYFEIKKEVREIKPGEINSVFDNIQMVLKNKENVFVKKFLQRQIAYFSQLGSPTPPNSYLKYVGLNIDLDLEKILAPYEALLCGTVEKVMERLFFNIKKPLSLENIEQLSTEIILIFVGHEWADPAISKMVFSLLTEIAKCFCQSKAGWRFDDAKVADSEAQKEFPSLPASSPPSSSSSSVAVPDISFFAPVPYIKQEKKSVEEKKQDSPHPYSKTEIKEVIKILRNGNNCQTNCCILTNDLLQFFITGNKPTKPSQIRKNASDGLFTFDSRYIPVKSESGSEFKSVLQLVTVDAPITDKGTNSFLPPDEQFFEKKGVVHVDTQLIDLTSRKKIPIHFRELSHRLKGMAHGSDGQVIFGSIGLGPAGASLENKEQGHELVFYATPNEVCFIDPQFYDGKLHTGDPIFYDIEKYYSFINFGKQGRFGENCFVIVYGEAYLNENRVIHTMGPLGLEPRTKGL